MFSVACVATRWLPEAPISTDPKLAHAFRALEAEIERVFVLRDPAGMLPFFEKLNREDDCCIHIALIGGSIACGHGWVNHPWKSHHASSRYGLHEPGGRRGTYAAQLVGWMNRANNTCCQRGHILTNMCQGGAGTDYILDRFAPELFQGVDLVLVDTAANDVNTFVSRFLKRREQRRMGQEPSVQKKTEGLVRTLLTLRPSVSVIYGAPPRATALRGASRPPRTAKG